MKKFNPIGEHHRTLIETNNLTLQEVSVSLTLGISLVAKIECHEKQSN